MNLSPETHTAAEVVRELGLELLPWEGGWFRRVAVGAPATGEDAAWPASGFARAPWSAIHALFTPEAFSALHRVRRADELWFFLAGDPLELVQLAAEGPVRTRLGRDVAAGERLQAVVAAGVWQGARLVAGGRWALVACVVVPEFRWDDFALGARDELLQQFPACAGEIAALTRAGT